jgi:DNA mismatch repair protein MutL
MKIKFLSDSTINRIAAGEVIERPASVVKELVENAIDAGSNKIDIILERSGKNLIIISDNGVGMSKEELEVAVERHTTSKLDETNLLNIHTFGFRGEALPSIASVSKMVITSKTIDSDIAYKIELIGGQDKIIKPAMHNEGTKIEIRDLFFATPARLKFLRTDRTELNAIIEVVKKISLSHPAISFALSHDKRTLLKTKGHDGDYLYNSKQRITDIMGEDFIKNSAKISLQRPELTIFGYTSIPTFNRASAEDQFLFINNRPIKDKILQIALRVAYQDYLAKDRYPVAAIFLQISPELVDVNVHPAKNEVRFFDPNLVKNLLTSAIKDALAENSHKVSTTIGDDAIKLFTNTHHKFEQQHYLRQPSTNFVNYVSDNNSPYRHQPKAIQAHSTQQHFVNSYSPTTEEQSIAITEIDLPLGMAKTQLHTTYIVSQTKDSIIIVDQHAAHERLGYERIKKMISRNGLIKQRILVPEIIELSSEQRAMLLYDRREDLSKLGLTIEKFGEKSIIVSEIPSILGDINVSKLIQDLVDHLSDLDENVRLIELIEHVTETYACHYSIRSGRKLSLYEMNELLRQMEQTPFSGQCNHGRPTYIELKLADIEKLFGRR